MPNGKRSNKRSDMLQTELERQILHGLSCEWEAALWLLEAPYRRRMRKPLFRIKEMRTRLGRWSPRTREICFSRDLVMNYSWDTVVDVLRHEMAHQLAGEVLGARNEPPHGPSFRRACDMLRISTRASGDFEPLHEWVAREHLRQEDRILLRVRKLMALAQSQNQNEAEAAMIKAHELIAKYNIDLMRSSARRDFVSVHVGTPALRHFREVYVLANLIQDFYFVEGIWIPAFVKEKGRMGRVLEISGTAQNIRMASYVYDFVRHFIDRQWRTYKKEKREKKLNRYRKTDFAIGILDGFRAKLEAEAEKKAAVRENRALVRVEDPQLAEYMDYRYPHTTSVRRRALRQDPSVLADGVEIGKRLVIAEGITETGEAGKYLPDRKK